MMKRTEIRARYGISVWGLATAAFSLTFCLRGGAVTYVDDSIRVFIAAMILATGFIAYFAMIYQTKEK